MVNNKGIGNMFRTSFIRYIHFLLNEKVIFLTSVILSLTILFFILLLRIG